LERHPADLVAIAADVVADARVRTQMHTFALEAPEHLVATIDAIRIEQVLTNLVENAIKYSPDGGAIDVRVRAGPAGRAEIAVRDHGGGIPPERRDRIFDRYYRAHADEQTSGMGLGLYVSREIAHLHGGTLRAEFPDDGGARFVVSLPLDDPPSPAVPAPAPSV
jgi:signal transduction histidine kinase